MHDASGLGHEIHEALLTLPLIISCLLTTLHSQIRSKHQDSFWDMALGRAGVGLVIPACDARWGPPPICDGPRRLNITISPSQPCSRDRIREPGAKSAACGSSALSCVESSCDRRQYITGSSWVPAWNPFDFGAVRDHIAQEDTILPSEFISTSLKLRQYIWTIPDRKPAAAAASGGIRAIPEMIYRTSCQST